MSVATLDVQAVRARFSALQRPEAFFDGPAGTQVPDEVIDAIAGYLRRSNANVGGEFETSRRTEALIDGARDAAARFLGCEPDETIFGPSMTNLNFSLTRTLGRELKPGDEVVVTRLDHDANVSPWLELEHDLGIVVRFADLDLSNVEELVSDRTRVV
ncbi:MAG TPA: aminotransferase class V-fold PLP-dependent enzyme, partial [Gaiellaceae bacterium]|nr:aminotransferase class V-fold PLP-dependent enzyme [Gaiellaceae bacterium]